MFDNMYLSKTELDLLEGLKVLRQKRQDMNEMARVLNIPLSFDVRGNSHLSMENLWDLLSDEKKIREVISYCNLKAFW